MRAGVLFSGGKDSSLAAILLSGNYEVELNTCIFDPSRRFPAVEAAADALGYAHRYRLFPQGVLDEAICSIRTRGFPNEAIQMVHRVALRLICNEYPVVGDGTRFGDRVPMLKAPEVQQIADRDGCSYVRPLLGYPKPEVVRLTDRYLVVRYGETGSIDNGDYEHEIRQGCIAQGIDPSPLFPAHHQQSLVTGRRDFGGET